MELSSVLVNSLWAALFATGLGVILTTSSRCLIHSFICGFTGRFVRDGLVSRGMSHDWATMIGAVAVVLVGVAIIRRHVLSPVVLISGVLPICPSAAMFNVIFELMKISSLSGEAASQASIDMIANLARVFTTSTAIALGLEVGIAIVQFFRRKEAFQGV